MGFGIMYFKGTKKMYSTNTGMNHYWSDDIERAAKIVQKKNAEKAVRSLYRDGVKEQLYVVEILQVPAVLHKIKKPDEKTGYVIVDPTQTRRGIYYSGAKKPSTFRSSGFSVLESASTFKTEKEAQKCLDTLMVHIDDAIKYYEDEHRRVNRRDTLSYISMYEDFKVNLEISKL